MKTTTQEINGAAIFWRTGETRLSGLATLADLGFGDFIPKARTPAASLKEALTSMYANSTTLVRAMDDEAAYAVVSEKRGSTSNDYDVQMTAQIRDGVLTVSEPGQTAEILRRIAVNEDRASQWSTTQSLVGIIARLGGIPLRPSGGVYWLPADRMDAWTKVAAIFEAAAVSAGDNEIFVMRTAADEKAHRAVAAAIAEDTAKQIADIEKQISEGGLKTRGLEARQRELVGLRARLTSYEGLLASTLTTTRAALDAADDAAAKAIMLAAADQAAEVTRG